MTVLADANSHWLRGYEQGFKDGAKTTAESSIEQRFMDALQQYKPSTALVPIAAATEDICGPRQVVSHIDCMPFIKSFLSSSAIDIKLSRELAVIKAGYKRHVLPSSSKMDQFMRQVNGGLNYSVVNVAAQVSEALAKIKKTT